MWGYAFGTGYMASVRVWYRVHGERGGHDECDKTHGGMARLSAVREEPSSTFSSFVRRESRTARYPETRCLSRVGHLYGKHLQNVLGLGVSFSMRKGKEAKAAFREALPIIVGYIALGLPCGILGAAADMSVLQILLLSVFMYSGSGQYMIPGMYLAGVPLLTLSASVSLVSTRQMLYSSAFAPYLEDVSKTRLIWYAATVTDESFGVNLNKFLDGGWTPLQAQLLNTFSHLSWIAANVVGALLGAWLVIDTAIASFAMTSIFLCLFLIQRFTRSHVIASIVSIVVVVLCKLTVLSNMAILIGAIAGVAAGSFAHTHLGGGSDDAVE
jgi:4-azaleucine resistance transporter AzlC